MGSQIIGEIIWEYNPIFILVTTIIIIYQIIREMAQTCMKMTWTDSICHSDHFGTLFIVFGAPMNK